MRFRFVGAVVPVLLLTMLCAQAASADGESLSDEERIWGLMQVWAEAKFNFPFFDQVPALDWDASVRRSISKVVSARDIESYYEVLMELAAQLEDGHTAVIPPWRFMRPGWDQPPVEIQVLEGRFFVARVGVSEALRDQRIYPGLEILEVGDGTPIRTYFEETVVRLGSRGTRQADEAVGLISLLHGPKGSPIPLKVRDLDGSERHITLVRRSLQDDGRPFQWRLLEWYEADPAVEMARLAGGVTYFRLANFGTPEGAEQFREIFDGLDLDSTKGIILDIRFNPGGGTLNAYDVVSCFIDEPVEGAMWKSRRYVPAHRSWAMDPEWEESEPAVIQPREGKRFLGPLVVLTGPATFSSAEDFLVPLRQSGRALLIGGATAGSTGNPIYVELPGGGMFRVVSKRDLFADGSDFVGVGIPPDIEVRPSRRDLFEGRDPVLEAGIGAISDWTSPTAVPAGRADE